MQTGIICRLIMYDTELCHLESFLLYSTIPRMKTTSVAGSTKLPQMISTQSLSGLAKVISMPGVSKAINTPVYIISSPAHLKQDRNKIYE